MIVGRYCALCGTKAVPAPAATQNDATGQPDTVEEGDIDAEISDNEVRADARNILIYYIQQFRDQGTQDPRYMVVADQLTSDLAKLEFLMGAENLEEVNVLEPPAKVPRIDPTQAVLSAPTDGWKPAQIARIIGIDENVAIAIEACGEEMLKVAPPQSATSPTRPIKEVALEIHKRVSARRRSKQPQ